MPVRDDNELLNSFNVATFKNQEDDATFWSRLIHTDDGPGGEGEDGVSGACELGPPRQRAPARARRCARPQAAGQG